MMFAEDYDIKPKYKTCKKCGTSQKSTSMCIDPKSFTGDLNNCDWYCDKCYIELMHKREEAVK